MATPADVIASRPVIAVLSLMAGTVAGVTLTSPASRAQDVDVRIHALRIERPLPGPSPALVHAEVYASARWVKADGGEGSRDLGPSRCTFTEAQNPVMTGRLVQLTNAAASRCDAGQGADWPHVTELHGASINGDAGHVFEVYTSRPLADGGRVDLGRAPECPPLMGDLPTVVENAVYKVAVRCAEEKLEDGLP